MPLIDNYLLDNYAIDRPSGLYRKTGAAISGDQSINFQRFGYPDGTDMGCRYITVSENFGFTPKLILITFPVSGLSGGMTSYMQSVYISYIKDSYGHSLIGHGDTSGNRRDVATGGGLNGFVNSTGFRLPVLVNNTGVSYTLSWEAIGWDD